MMYNMRFAQTDYSAPTFHSEGNDVFYHNMLRYWPIIPVTDPNGHYTDPSGIEQLKNGGRYETP